MKSFLQLLFCWLIFCEKSKQSDDHVVLINDPTRLHSVPYTIIKSADRLKRDRSNGLYPELHSDEHCDQFIYTKLYAYSHLTDCSALAACLESIHCPPLIKSHGSLILNLLNLLGVSSCKNDDLHSSCPNDKRSIILYNLITHWNDNRLTDPLEETNAERDSYCHTVPSFITEVTEEIKDHCPLYSRQVEAFLENYLCRTTHLTVPSKTTSTPKEYLHWSASDEGVQQSSTTASKIALTAEEYDDDLHFINANTNLSNTTEQTVFLNDHQYYNVSYIIPESERFPVYFVQDNEHFLRIHALADQHRSAFNINLKFSFPFYGHSINKILVGTGGFIDTGDLRHTALIGNTQYIAPLMANFDLSIGGNQSEIKYFDNGTHLVCTWNNLYLQHQQDAGPFTFQTILENNGNIYFNYIHIPQVNESSLTHTHRMGLSDAYVSQHSSNEHTIRVITLYHKLDLDREKVRNGVSIVFNMDNLCNTFTDCTSCLANRGKRYNCSWCDDIQRCSDGFDRSRHHWMQAQCHLHASDETCPTNDEEDPFNQHHSALSTSTIAREQSDSHETPHSYSILYTFRTIVVTLLITVLILCLLAFLGSYLYAYRHPTSPPGMWLLEHRPSNYIARFKRFPGTNSETA